MTFVQITLFYWVKGRHKGYFFFKCFFSETIRRIKLKLGILAYNMILYKSYVFIVSVKLLLLLWQLTGFIVL